MASSWYLHHYWHNSRDGEWLWPQVDPISNPFAITIWDVCFYKQFLVIPKLVYALRITLLDLLQPPLPQHNTLLMSRRNLSARLLKTWLNYISISLETSLSWHYFWVCSHTISNLRYCTKLHHQHHGITNIRSSYYYYYYYLVRLTVWSFQQTDAPFQNDDDGDHGEVESVRV